jgi:hypothetical protein
MRGRRLRETAAHARQIARTVRLLRFGVFGSVLTMSPKCLLTRPPNGWRKPLWPGELRPDEGPALVSGM